MLGKLFDGNLLGAHRNPVLYIVLPDDVFSRRVCWIRLDVGVLGCAGNAWAMVSARSSLHSAAAVVGMYRMTQLYSRIIAAANFKPEAKLMEREMTTMSCDNDIFFVQVPFHCVEKFHTM